MASAFQSDLQMPLSGYILCMDAGMPRSACSMRGDVPMDTLSKAQRSERMGRVRSNDTKLELKVRRLVHSMGYRYRLHVKDLPGHPDMVFAGRKKIILVHGCFWHRQEACGRLPKSRLDFWVPKLEANRQRDIQNEQRLREMGWDVLEVWECQVRDASALQDRVREFMRRGG